MNGNDTETASRTDWKRLETMPDEDIDYSDIPPLGEKFFEHAKLYIPDTHAIVLDNDVFSWQEHQEQDSQTLVNTILRQYIAQRHGVEDAIISEAMAEVS